MGDPTRPVETVRDVLSGIRSAADELARKAGCPLPAPSHPEVYPGPCEKHAEALRALQEQVLALQEAVTALRGAVEALSCFHSVYGSAGRVP